VCACFANGSANVATCEDSFLSIGECVTVPGSKCRWDQEGDGDSCAKEQTAFEASDTYKRDKNENEWKFKIGAIKEKIKERQ